MKKFYYSLAVVALINCLQAHTVAGTIAEELNMDIYAEWAGYGFLAILTICFMYFLHYSTTRIEEPVKANAKSAAKNIIPVSFSGAAPAQFKLAMYAAVSLVLLNITIFVLLIT